MFANWSFNSGETEHMAQDIKVPDIGDFDDVPVIEILVSPGDTVEAEDPLLTLESDKATMDIPAPKAGKIVEIKVAVGDRVSEGTVIVTMDAADGEAADTGHPKAQTSRRGHRLPHRRRPRRLRRPHRMAAAPT
jgi:pyruvate/2-oxoglutarate dehydrogenase complex dihydrolipoamide acyltransferase (E2) component